MTRFEILPDDSRHDRLYKQASNLIEGLILYHNEEPAPLDDAGRKRLHEAALLFGEVLNIDPQNWPALWLLGKIHQRLADHNTALQYFNFIRAHEINPAHPDVTREASIAAMDSGNPEAVGLAQAAVAINPTNAGLRANLALALLFSQRPAEALAVAETALRASIVAEIQEVLAGQRACPRHIRELE